MATLYEHGTDLIRRIYDRRISTPPVLDAAAHFPDGARFVEAWPELRSEALAACNRKTEIPRFHDLMPEQAEISANDGRDWRMLVLKAYGVPFRANLAKCPRLAELLAANPDVLSATLSILAPGKHIPAHRGPFRGVLRFHLGLSVPVDCEGRPNAVLKIATREYRLADGDSLLWDDTFTHEVWNHGDDHRIALLLDVRRRGMPLGLTLLSRLLIGVIGLFVRLRKPR